MGEHHFIIIETITRHEQVARQPFLDIAACVGERDVTGLYGEYMGITEKTVA
jgi:hypothetical protein